MQVVKETVSERTYLGDTLENAVAFAARYKGKLDIRLEKQADGKEKRFIYVIINMKDND